MDTLAEREKEKYEKMWRDPDYRIVSPAVRDHHRFLRACKPAQDDTITDFGCGTGRGAMKLFELGFNVQLLDITEKALDKEACTLLDQMEKGEGDRAFWFIETCLWDLDSPKNFIAETDWIFCFDVMEHIPEEKVDAVFENALKKMIKGGFFQICTIPDGFGKRIGETLHLTVKPAAWWLEKLGQYFEIVHSEEVKSHLYVHVKPKG